tara:strand:+ start:1910 stop:2200 length:291 start_codon:yes stop_codon:yes gene_type:complete
MDYHIIDHIIRKKNFSLFPICKNKYYIIKNEHGTYGEYYDFIIKIELCDNNNIINVDVISDDKDCEKQIKKIVNDITVSGNVQFDKFCFAILDCNI